MVQSSVLGFPRMGVLRDLKKATEAYWAGKLSRDDLLAEGKRLRLKHWQIQKDAGVDIIPSNDFAFYDQVLDHIELFGVRSDCPDGRVCLTVVAGRTGALLYPQAAPN
jgi:5-methyltetrahydropteroyltriglutamate--homocysteine methyltransferase